MPETPALTVAKFGGTSLADADAIRRCVEIVRADPARRVVVPSAPGKRHGDDPKVTDLLYLCHDHAERGLPFAAVFERIRERFRGISAGLDLGAAFAARLGAALDAAEAGIREHAGRGPDFAASRGEALNGLVLAEALGFACADAAGVIRFAHDGRLDAGETRRLLREARGSAGAGLVVPGFYGADAGGTVRTFSRGGSDVTGAAVAAALDAAVYENWTDVSGLLMADPRVVDAPRSIERVTYRELRELSYMGATVLHPEAVFPVRAAGIPVNIRNTSEPAHPGTLIVSAVPPGEEPPGAPPITGVAGKRGYTAIQLEKALMNEAIGYGERVLSVLRRHGVSFEHVPSGIDTLSVVVSDAEVDGKLVALVDDLQRELEPDALEVDTDLALIATVGRRMRTRPGMAATLFGALGAAGVNIRMIDQGSSELNIIVGVNESDFEAAVRAIYAAFVIG
ncbi:aspartate kinase [Phycisphaera mikurensis]|uniref:Aspartokinase n=1 Tax=Phycisphaera mikurensis (strain NBRC 102666 / KCTC 22515 / FYK2301M01) TaxID=1142394 RepID=I0IIV7_PHYMF|nr:aspartate kinase [Phycisphaera mikurensis]MBB6443360.1 aspartate kinase [Phycisphaera mikurensis]BAM05195.1 aspartokinase [Phycisphaera mikurensis NBRC 102666]